MIRDKLGYSCIVFTVFISLFLARNADARSIFGTDNREGVVVKNKNGSPLVNYPWTSVGRLLVDLKSGGDMRCTASLIRPNIILTAAHCFMNDRGQLLDIKGAWFQAGYYYGEAVPGGRSDLILNPMNVGKETKLVPQFNIGFWDIKEIGDGFKNSIEPKNASLQISSARFAMGDYAVVQLATPITSVQPLLINSSDPSTLPKMGARFFSAGYSGDFYDKNSQSVMGTEMLSVHKNCNITDAVKVATLNGAPIYSLKNNCDMNHGASGGPIFLYDQGQYSIVGLNDQNGFKLKDGKPVEVINAPSFSPEIANVATSSHSSFLIWQAARNVYAAKQAKQVKQKRK